MTKKTAFISIIGIPNAGKSTLTNALIGQKIGIVSPKPHTTRIATTGILTEGDTQLVFIDSPGFMPQAETGAQKSMLTAVYDAIEESDLCLHVVDCSKKNPFNKDIETHIKRAAKKTYLLLNKIDHVKKDILLPLIAKFDALGIYDKIFMISALKNDGVQDVKQALLEAATPADWPYDEDQLSTLSTAALACELTREQVFLNLHQELPYKADVLHEKWETAEDGITQVYQQIVVAKSSHKGIVVGKGGQTLKTIGAAARGEIKQLIGQPLRLFLHVKVAGKNNIQI